MNTNKLLITMLLFNVMVTFAQKPLSDPNGDWEFVPELSDEFHGASLDNSKWNNNPGSWGAWSWDQNNAYLSNDDLKIRAVQETHTRNGKELYYKSGIARSTQTITYGYFEARIKGCKRFPGLAPAFWLYSSGSHNLNDITYSEIDIIEIQQGGPIGKIDMNLHTREMINGVETWRRPGSWPEVCANHWTASWDPRDDYHVYACENRPDSIFWYVDGILRAAQKNYNWHLPMYITLSMGLRSPLVGWDANGNMFPKSESTTHVDFPTEMHIDYVRTWKKGSPNSKPLDNGTYEIQSAVNDNVVGIAAWSSFELFDREGSTTATKWRFTHIKDSLYTIYNTMNSKYLTVDCAKDAKPVGHSSMAQQWKITPVNGGYMIQAKDCDAFALDLYPVDLYVVLTPSATVNNNHIWKLNLISREPETHTNPVPVIPDRLYTISNVALPKLTIGFEANSDNEILISEANNFSNKWNFKHVGNNVYEITNPGYANRYLSVEPTPCADGNILKLSASSANANDHEKWKVFMANDSSFTFSPLSCKNRVMDANPGNENVSVRFYYGQNGIQHWRLTKAVLTSLQDNSTDQVQIFAVGENSIVFKNVNAGSHYKIINLMGQQLKEGIVRSTNEMINMHESGILIVALSSDNLFVSRKIFLP